MKDINHCIRETYSTNSPLKRWHPVYLARPGLFGIERINCVIILCIKIIIVLSSEFGTVYRAAIFFSTIMRGKTFTPTWVSLYSTGAVQFAINVQQALSAEYEQCQYYCHCAVVFQGVLVFMYGYISFFNVYM